MDFVNELKTMPIAVLTEKANEQHYEVRLGAFASELTPSDAVINDIARMQLPTQYFDHVLGKWKKYSSCLYRDAKDDLDTAEESMLGTLSANNCSWVQATTTVRIVREIFTGHRS